MFSLHHFLPLSGIHPSSFSPDLSPRVCSLLKDEENRVNFGVRLRCNAISKSRTQEYAELFQNGLPVLKWPEIEGDEIEGEEALEDMVWNEVRKRVESIKLMLGAMGDGETTVSAYDTAWVALVEDVNGSGLPQFPSTLEWIVKNQLLDGSWGDAHIFSAHDRILNTLACVVALKSWNIHPEKYEKGMLFLKENIWKLENENTEHMPIGFEILFPSLIEIAKNLDIEVPSESPAVQEIYTKRNLKLTRIPKDLMHTLPTSLLHSLEGMKDLDWQKLLKLQNKDGSFLFSPSSTAFALMQTKDENCLNYLKKVVEKFNGGVPNVYPLDLFEHMWAVDRIQRLGISRYFQSEIKDCMDYVYRYWTEEGICWARNSLVHDIDDTAMGFRLLRLHGYDMSGDVFRHFKRGDEFFCFVGQSTQAVTGMFNLYRASQIQFPGEEILENAKEFSSKFLKEMRASNELVDKWIITKDLPGEVGYALDIPWYASLPRVETRFYIDQYGGDDDVWIGKTLYRMNNVNNNIYLELAKLDYNTCQALHRIEWDTLQMWYMGCKLDEFGMSRKSVLRAYFLAAASIFEPERSKERLAWAKTSVLIETIASHFNREGTSVDQRRAFYHEFVGSVKNRNYINGRSNSTAKGLVGTLIGTLNHITLDTMVAHGRDISHHLHQAWQKWLIKWQEEGDTHQGQAELLVQILNLSAGHRHLEELFNNSQYQRLLNLTNGVCHRLSLHLKQKELGANGSHNVSLIQVEIDSEMQELVKLVLQKSSDGTSSDMKQTFLTVAKTFYYSAHCSARIVNSHISKVLFESVE